MKKAIAVCLVLSIVIIPALGSCAAQPSATVLPSSNETVIRPEVSLTDEITATTPVVLSTQITEASSPQRPTYDFSEFELPAGLSDNTGLDNSHWGDSMEDVIATAASQGTTSLRITEYTKILAGLNFVAEYFFNTDENNTTKLVSVIYIRNSYLDVYDAQTGMQEAISDYNMLLAYLTEQFGTPWRSIIVGESIVDITDTINDFMALKASTANTIWRPSVSSFPTVWLQLDSKGLLYIQFFSDLFYEKPEPATN